MKRKFRAEILLSISMFGERNTEGKRAGRAFIHKRFESVSKQVQFNYLETIALIATELLIKSADQDDYWSILSQSECSGWYSGASLANFGFGMQNVDRNSRQHRSREWKTLKLQKWKNFMISVNEHTWPWYLWTLYFSSGWYWGILCSKTIGACTIIVSTYWLNNRCKPGV